MDTTPDHNEAHYTTTTTTSTTGGPAFRAFSISINLTYLRTLPAMLKIAEMVLALFIIIFVAASFYWSHTANGGFVVFVGSAGLIATLLLFSLHLVWLIYKLPGPWVFIEFIYLCVMALFYLIAGSVSAADGRHGGGAIAASIFCFINLVVHCVELFLSFRMWRTAGNYYMACNTNATTTTKTTEEYAASP